MESEGYWDDEIITKHEYFRVKSWWITSGALNKLSHEFINSFESFFPELSQIGMDFLLSQDDWVSWFFEFFEWWPNEFDEFAGRVMELACIGDISYEYLSECAREWWESTAPIRMMESLVELTHEVVVDHK